MNFQELAWNRKSIRNFKHDDVPADKIVRLLDAARSAPSGGNCQPWFFYAIKDAAIKQRIYELSFSGRMILDAPVCIVVCADIKRSSGTYGERGKSLYCIQDTAAAIQNLLLCAVDEGLAGCWCGAFDEESLSGILELDRDMRPVAIIPVGYAVSEPPKTSRRPVEEISAFIGFDDKPIAINESEPHRTKIERQDISGALFNDLNLESSEFVNINMRGCTFSGINLSNARISGCDLSNMEITDCKLDGFTVNGRAI